MKRMIFFLLLGAALLSAQTPPGDSEPWNAVRFLEGTWGARTQSETSGVNATGAYTFQKELGGHILARHSSVAGCKGPADYNCEHSDLLYIYQETPGQPLKAIYFDNEGHVIHYAVSAPAPGSAVFLSDGTAPGPQFRLTYDLKGAIMSGKFQIHMPGQAGWKSYLEWIGAKQ